MDKKEQAAREQNRRKLESKLGGDERAKGVLKCLYSGVRKRRHIAAKLGIDVKAVTAAPKRLERKAKVQGVFGHTNRLVARARHWRLAVHKV